MQRATEPWVVERVMRNHKPEDMPEETFRALLWDSVVYCDPIYVFTIEEFGKLNLARAREIYHDSPETTHVYWRRFEADGRPSPHVLPLYHVARGVYVLVSFFALAIDKQAWSEFRIRRE